MLVKGDLRIAHLHQLARPEVENHNLIIEKKAFTHIRALLLVNMKDDPVGERYLGQYNAILQNSRPEEDSNRVPCRSQRR